MSRRVLTTTAAAGTLFLTAALLAGCSSAAGDAPAAAANEKVMPETLVISVIPTEDQMDLDMENSVLFGVLERELGIPVEFHPATSYAATIEAQRAGKAHIATYGPFAYMLAKDSGVDIDIIAAGVGEPDAEVGYYAVGSVAADSDITSIKDAKGKTVCFVDPASTSGYLFPSAGLLEAGIDPTTDITPMFAGGHDASVLALADGQCEIAFSTEGMATTNLIESGQLKAGAIKQIWQSELLAPNPVTVSNTLPDELVERIKKIYRELLNVPALTASGDCDTSDEAGRCGLDVYSYQEVEDSDYDGVRKVCDITKVEACSIANQ